VMGHESILKLISYRFGLGYLTKRHRYARNAGRSFNWQSPNFDAVGLPDPPEIVTQRCEQGGRDVLDSQQAHASDLAGLEEYAARVGVPVSDSSAFNIFTKPDSVQRAVRRTRAAERAEARAAAKKRVARRR